MQPPNYRDSTDSLERDRGPLTHDNEDEEGGEDGAYRRAYGDNESSYVENCGSERHDESDSRHSKDDTNNDDAGRLHGQLNIDDYKTSFVDGKKTAYVLLFCIDSLIEEIGAIKTISGLSDHMSKKTVVRQRF